VLKKAAKLQQLAKPCARVWNSRSSATPHWQWLSKAAHSDVGNDLQRTLNRSRPCPYAERRWVGAVQAQPQSSLTMPLQALRQPVVLTPQINDKQPSVPLLA